MPEDTPQAPKPDSFETCLGELERTVMELETGELPLERSLELFEKGMALSEACRKQLEDAQTRVEIMIRRQGKAEPEPFTPER
jgi:exodeoxyribonuclease VII small subunit